jgi:ATP-binding cassette subfamily C protein LapB
MVNRGMSDISTATFNKLSEKKNWLFSTLSHFWSVYAYALLSAFFGTILSMAPVLYTRLIYDKVIPHAAYKTMVVLTIGVLVVILFDILIGIIKNYLLDFINRNTDVILSNKLINKILNVSLANNQMLAGALAGRVRELEVLRDFMSSFALVSLVDMPFVILFLVLLCYFSNGLVVAICITSMCLMLLINIIIAKIIQDYSEINHDLGHKKNTFLVEVILGLESIKANIAEERFAGIWSELTEAQANASKVERNLTAIAGYLLGFVQNLNYIAMVVVGAYMIMQNQLSIGALVACSVLGSRILVPFTQIVNLTVRYRHVKMAYISLTNIMLNPAERQREGRFISKSAFLGQIEFQNVDFSYKEENNLVLQDVSFSINAGERVALLGSIGSGKSTISKLILGLYKPSGGNIFIDGIEIQKLHPYDLRSHISYVSQDNFLFSSSIIENIMVSPLVRSGNVDDLQKAINIAGINQILSSKKDGLKSEVGQGGNKLSGGQRQAISLARGLANDAPIIILDEPTSMMDSAAEASLWEGLQKLDQKTMLIITHNLKVLDIVDKVIFLEGGKIKFFGTKEDFIKLANSQNRLA